MTEHGQQDDMTRHSAVASTMGNPLTLRRTTTMCTLDRFDRG